MTTKTMTPTQDYEQAVQAVADWTGELENARAELSRLEGAPVADAAAAKKQAGQLATAREYSYRCARGLDTAIDARDAAAAAVVEAEAADLQPEIDKARAELDSFDGKVSALLEPLEKFTGRRWTETDPAQAWRAAGGDGRVTVPASTRSRLAGALKSVERRAQALRHAAAGGDPLHIVGDPPELPDSLKPGGVMPSPTLVAAEQARAEQEAADREQAAQLAEAQATVDEAVRSLGIDLAVTADQPPSAWTDQRGARWRARVHLTGGQERAMWSDVNGHAARMTALTTIAALCGWDAGTEAARLAIPSVSTTDDEAPGE